MRSRSSLNFRILTQVVAEKSLTKKKVYRQTNKQTNIITGKAKTIYPYILRTGGINMRSRSSLILSDLLLA